MSFANVQLPSIRFSMKDADRPRSRLAVSALLLVSLILSPIQGKRLTGHREQFRRTLLGKIQRLHLPLRLDSPRLCCLGYVHL
jgi:hypothetical protein